MRYIVHDMISNEATQYADLTTATNDMQEEYKNYYQNFGTTNQPDLRLFEVKEIEFEVIPAIVT